MNRMAKSSALEIKTCEKDFLIVTIQQWSVFEEQRTSRMTFSHLSSLLFWKENPSFPLNASEDAALLKKN